MENKSDHCHISFIDEKVIENISKELLKDKNFNQKLIPDSMEAKIYTSSVDSSLQITSKILEKLRLEFMGHELCMYLRPIQK